MSFFWEDSSGLINILIKVKPNAKKSLVLGLTDVIVHYPVKKALLVSVASPAKDGKANEELLKILSEFLNIRISNINIETGNKGRIKLVRISEKIQTSILMSLIKTP